jgi:hypothetical protein
MMYGQVSGHLHTPEIYPNDGQTDGPHRWYRHYRKTDIVVPSEYLTTVVQPEDSNLWFVDFYFNEIWGYANWFRVYVFVISTDTQ